MSSITANIGSSFETLEGVVKDGSENVGQLMEDEDLGGATEDGDLAGQIYEAITQQGSAQSCCRTNPRFRPRVGTSLVPDQRRALSSRRSQGAPRKRGIGYWQPVGLSRIDRGNDQICGSGIFDIGRHAQCRGLRRPF